MQQLDCSVLSNAVTFGFTTAGSIIIRTEGLKETKINLNTVCPDQNSNPGPPEYKSAALSLQPTCCVKPPVSNLRLGQYTAD